MGGHGLPLRPTKYRSIDEIPDSMVLQNSKRDPTNEFYKTRRWFDFKKEQILFSQNDGIPSYLRTPGRKIMHYTVVYGSVVLLFANIYNYWTLSSKK